MSSGAKTSADILAGINRYIKSTPREQILRDIDASRFDLYYGIGERFSLANPLRVPNYDLAFEYAPLAAKPNKAATQTGTTTSWAFETLLA